MSRVALIIFNILIILALLIGISSFIANILFKHKVKKEVKKLFDCNPDNKKDVITKADIANLPACVQKWLERSDVIGKERIKTVRLKQKGFMRIKENGPWMQCNAEQYFTIDEPGFVWKAKVKMAPLLYFAGRDQYYEGKGHMLIKVLSLLPVVNSKGNEINQGTLLRYLAETQWFPTAALSNCIKWEEIDSHSARATMSYKGVTASGVFYFNDQRDPAKFVAKRYRELNGKYELTDWETLTKEYKEFNGIRIPLKTDVIWKLETGDFNWFKCEITEIEYNKPIIF